MDNLETAIESLILAHDIAVDYDGYSKPENLKELIDEIRSLISAAITTIAKEQDAHKREIKDPREAFKVGREAFKVGRETFIRDFISTYCQHWTMSMAIGMNETQLTAFNAGIDYVKKCLMDELIDGKMCCRQNVDNCEPPKAKPCSVCGNMPDITLRTDGISYKWDATVMCPDFCAAITSTNLQDRETALREAITKWNNMNVK